VLTLLLIANKEKNKLAFANHEKSMSRCFSFLYSKKKEKDLFHSAFINPLISLKD
jgi:hypothetical protein